MLYSCVHCTYQQSSLLGLRYRRQCVCVCDWVNKTDFMDMKLRKRYSSGKPAAALMASPVQSEGLTYMERYVQAVQHITYKLLTVCSSNFIFHKHF